jgi:ATP-dependent helicase HrpA
VRELPATGDREAKLQLTETGRQLSRIPLIRVWRRW